MFFAYNNGIAATAYNVEIEHSDKGDRITKIRSLQIVNGGQTTASLAAAIINDKARANNLKNIYVPMKLSVVSPEMALKLIPNIAKYANRIKSVMQTSSPIPHPTYRWRKSLEDSLLRLSKEISMAHTGIMKEPEVSTIRLWPG